MSSKDKFEKDKNKFSFFRNEEKEKIEGSRRDSTDKDGDGNPQKNHQCRVPKHQKMDHDVECEPGSSFGGGRYSGQKGKHKVSKKSFGSHRDSGNQSVTTSHDRVKSGKCHENEEYYPLDGGKPTLGIPESYMKCKSKDRSYNKSFEQIGSRCEEFPSLGSSAKFGGSKDRFKRRNTWIPFHKNKLQSSSGYQGVSDCFGYDHFSKGRRSKATHGSYEQSEMPYTPRERFLPSRKRQKTFVMENSVKNVSESCANSSQSTPTAPSVRHIPGFYYDPEKKRYFKILPGHSNANSSCVTEETLKNMQAENARQRLFSEQHDTKAFVKAKKSAVNIRQSIQLGKIYPQKYFRDSIDCRIRALDVEPTNSLDLSTVLDYHVSGISSSDHIRYLEVDRSQTKVLMVISNDAISRIHLGTIATNENRFKKLEFKDWSPVTVIDTRKSAINTACLVNVDQQDISYPGSLYVLFAMSGEGNNVVRLIKCPSDEEDVSYISYSMESKREIYHSCAWSNNPFLPAHLSVGLHLQAEVVDILSSNRIKLDTNQNEVYSQVFAKRSTVLYNGIKNGDILTFDLRASPRSWREHLRPMQQVPQLHSGAVCSLKLLKDEDYLLAADFSGAIKLWDLRVRRVVLELEGHHNEYKILPVMLDHTESIVCAVGQDKHTRLWNMKNGSHLRTVPSPLPVSETAIPAAAVSLDWGKRNFPGLLVGAQRKLFWYPL